MPIFEEFSQEEKNMRNKNKKINNKKKRKRLSKINRDCLNIVKMGKK